MTKAVSLLYGVCYEALCSRSVGLLQGVMQVVHDYRTCLSPYCSNSSRAQM